VGGRRLPGAFTLPRVVEARALGRAYDMPPDKLMEIFANASANSFPVQNWDALESNWDHYITLLIKDVGLCLEAAGHSDVGMPMIDAANRYRLGQAIT
jgi:3-hydroxyisobutyrate dehydrogenase-like beta-hydroxyacid dehydrogenase